MTRVLSADIGGTKSLFRITSVRVEETVTEREELFDSRGFNSLREMLARFVAGDGKTIAAACLAVAGPANGRSARVTNLGWRESAADLESHSMIKRISLVNDFFAVAAGIPSLGSSDVVPINVRSRDANGTVAILGAGTGLGEAVSVDFGTRRKIISSEGGHSSFAPRSHVQRLLLDFLEERYGHVSYERLLSGPGIVNIFTFFCECVFGVSTADGGVPDDETHKAARISALADEGHDIACRTIETFVDIYGAEAGNLALKVLPAGGVYVCGGIAAKNLPWFEGERFLSAYADKGRMRDLLLEFPIDVVSNAKLGLIGATTLAVELAEEG
jgi:glucokinase